MTTTPATKSCSRCGTTYPATDEYFRPNKRCRGGIEGTCRVCVRRGQVANYRHLRAASRNAKAQEKAAMPVCEHGIQGFCKRCYNAQWARENAARNLAYCQHARNGRHGRSGHARLLDSIEPWQVLLVRIVGQAADDYCMLTQNDEAWWSADDFFYEAGVSERRIRQAARTYQEACRLEDAKTTNN